MNQHIFDILRSISVCFFYCHEENFFEYILQYINQFLIYPKHKFFVFIEISNKCFHINETRCIDKTDKIIISILHLRSKFLCYSYKYEFNCTAENV